MAKYGPTLSFQLEEAIVKEVFRFEVFRLDFPLKEKPMDRVSKTRIFGLYASTLSFKIRALKTPPLHMVKSRFFLRADTVSEIRIS